MSQTNAADLIKGTMKKKSSNRTKQLAFEDDNENFVNHNNSYASLMSEFDKKSQLN